MQSTPSTLPQGLLVALERALLACPSCGSALKAEGRSLLCPRRHCFDVARQGHVHLAPGKRASATYGRALMEARAAVVERGFFSSLVSWCANTFSQSATSLTVLDAGCGEGSLLAQVCTASGAIGVGVDLASEGIRMAASRYKRQAWCVGDLAAIPSPPGAYDVVLNILSPASYSEFLRVLRPGGRLIKAIPTSRHLKELRVALGVGEDFSNQRVADHFRSFFPNCEQMIIENTLPCGADGAAHVLAMTPLGWHANAQHQQAFLQHPPSEVSVSLEVFSASKP